MNKWSVGLLCMLIGLLNNVSSSVPIRVQDNAPQKESMLRLSGRVITGEIIDIGSESASGLETADRVKLQLTLGLDIKNDGPRKALLFKREPVVIERKIIATSPDAKADKDLYLLQTLPSIENPWKELQERFDRPTPPPDAIRVLAPGETWSFVTKEWFYINKKGDDTSKPWSEILEASTVSLQLTLEMWSEDVESYSERDKLKFSRMLQHRWRGFGDLRLEDLTSDRISLDLSSLTLKKDPR